MERIAQRDLEILSAVASGEPVTQRNLAQRLGIALGLANLYLKRLAHKGYIKVTTIPPNRLKYLLTPKGITEKSRLTYEYMEYSLKLYRQARNVLRDALMPLVQQGKQRGAIFGTAEAAELAFLTLREMGIGVSVVVGEDTPQGTFFGVPIRRLVEFTHQDVDLVIVASFTDTDGAMARLTQHGVPGEKIFTLTQRPAAVA